MNIRQRLKISNGFTLVELMVSMVIALIIMAGIATIFTSTKRSNQIQAIHRQMLQNGRFALDMIASDLRRAGYLGGNLEPSLIEGTAGRVAVSNTCNTGDTSWARMIEQPLFGLDDTNSGYSCIPDSSYLRGDVLVTRYASGEPATALAANRLFLRSSLFEGRIFPGSSSPTNAITETPQSTRELVAHAYYLGASDKQCIAGTPIPALMLVTLDDDGRPTTFEQIIGVDHLAFQYGVDADADGSVETYVDADAVANWADIAAVRFSVLLRAECPDPDYSDTNTYAMGDVDYTPNDNYRRRLESLTVLLRN